jgi:hypothetical protein
MARHYFEQRIAKNCWNFATKGKSSDCLEIRYEQTGSASFPLRPSVKMLLENRGAPGGRALPQKAN